MYFGWAVSVDCKTALARLQQWRWLKRTAEVFFCRWSPRVEIFSQPSDASPYFLGVCRPQKMRQRPIFQGRSGTRDKSLRAMNRALLSFDFSEIYAENHAHDIARADTAVGGCGYIHIRRANAPQEHCQFIGCEMGDYLPLRVDLRSACHRESN